MYSQVCVSIVKCLLLIHFVAYLLVLLWNFKTGPALEETSSVQIGSYVDPFGSFSSIDVGLDSNQRNDFTGKAIVMFVITPLTTIKDFYVNAYRLAKMPSGNFYIAVGQHFGYVTKPKTKYEIVHGYITDTYKTVTASLAWIGNQFYKYGNYCLNFAKATMDVMFYVRDIFTNTCYQSLNIMFVPFQKIVQQPAHIIVNRGSKTLSQVQSVRTLAAQKVSGFFSSPLNVVILAFVIIELILITFTINMLRLKLRQSQRREIFEGHDVTKHSRYRYRTIQVIGQDPFCRIFIVARTHRETRYTTRFIVKRIRKHAVPRSGLWYHVNPHNWIDNNYNVKLVAADERAAYKHLSFHPFFPTLLYAKMARGNMYFVFGIPQGDSLGSMLCNGPIITKKPVRQIASELMSAIEFMHGFGITMGNFHLENVFISNGGHVTVLPPGLLSLHLEKYPEIDSDNNVIGVESEKPRNFEDDWYNLAVCIMSMLSGRRVKTGENKPFEVLAQALRPNRLTPGSAIGSLLHDLVTPGTPRNFRDHKFFAGFDFDLRADPSYTNSPLFLCHDLLSLDRYFSETDLMKDEDAEMAINEVIRYLEGQGNYLVEDIE